MAQLGVIGGSGVYQMEGAELVKEHDIETPFGRPSDPIIEAKVGNETVYFVPRHGKGHRFLPTEVPYQANIFALKTLGVTHVLAVSAVGIMRPEINPGDMVVPNQLFDRTKGIRESTFFGNGIAGHVTFADPFCEQLRQVVIKSARNVGAQVHDDGAYVCMEGPQFSTRAESHFYRKTLNPVVIGMTGIPEAKLAMEAEMGYAMLALATDYDCWNEDEEDVSVEAVVAVLKANAEKANAIVRDVAGTLPKDLTSSSATAAQYAIMTSPDAIPADRRKAMEPLWGKYLNR